MPTPKQRPAAKSASKPAKSRVAAAVPVKSKPATKAVIGKQVTAKSTSQSAIKEAISAPLKPTSKAAVVRKPVSAPKPVAAKVAAKVSPLKKVAPTSMPAPVAKRAPAKSAPKPNVAKPGSGKTTAAASKSAQTAKQASAPKAVAAPKAQVPTTAVSAKTPAKPEVRSRATASPAAHALKPTPAQQAELALKPAAAVVVSKPTAKKSVSSEPKPSVQAGVKPAAASAKPAVEKRLMPTKMAPPAVISKVMKMTKANEAANNLANLKCPFTKEELGQWRSLLIGRRLEISSDIDALEKDAMEAEDGHTTPLHAAERGSDADLQDVSLGLAGEEKDLLWQIDRALRKIDLSSPIPFGICEYTKEAIPRLRLQLIPWTPLSIEGATYMEENGLTIEDVILDD